MEGVLEHDEGLSSLSPHDPDSTPKETIELTYLEATVEDGKRKLSE